MRVAALSDFHIGATRRMDGFRHSEDDFCRFLDTLERDHDEIVLLGDVFQTEHSWSLTRSAMEAELERARSRVPRLWARISRRPYTYVHGNHDAVASTTTMAVETHRIAADDFSIYFVHGHQFDPLLVRARPAAKMATWFSGRVRALRLGRVADWLEHQDIRIKHERFSKEDGPYVAAAKRLMRDHSHDVVVMGHTHVRARVDTPDGTYLNTGTCSMAQFSYVSIDTANRASTLHSAPSST